MGNSWNVHVNSIIYSKIMINLLQKSYISVLFAKHVVIGKSDVNSLCTCAHDAISYSNFKRNDVVPPRMNFPAKLVWNEFGWVFFFFKIKKKWIIFLLKLIFWGLWMRSVKIQNNQNHKIMFVITLHGTQVFIFDIVPPVG